MLHLTYLDKSTLLLALLSMLPAHSLAATPAEAQTRALVSGCRGCHGVDGHGYHAIPDLGAGSAAGFLAAMRAFQSGERQGTVMNRISQGFSAEELSAMARLLYPRNPP